MLGIFLSSNGVACMKLLSACLVAALICGIAFASALQFGASQGVTSVNGTISSDTTWTQANSPYNFTGPVGIASGVTLTIEPGATVNLRSYYIQVNGTLDAQGSSTNPIYFNGGTITFTSLSNSWNEQTATGCIIENAIIDGTAITSTNTLRMDGDSMNGEINIGPSIFFNNIVTGGSVTVYGAAQIFNNTVNDSSIGSNGGDPSLGFPTITNNTVTNCQDGITVSNGYAVISNNLISYCQTGIDIFTFSLIGQSAPYPIIQNNAVINNTQGISISVYNYEVAGFSAPLTVINNTISQNSVGIYLYENNYGTGPIQNNNIEDSQTTTFT